MTKHPDDAKGAGDRPVLEIEVTEEMVEAADRVWQSSGLGDLLWFDLPTEITIELYRAMHNAAEAEAR
jgi:hypothetical protein